MCPPLNNNSATAKQSKNRHHGLPEHSQHQHQQRPRLPPKHTTDFTTLTHQFAIQLLVRRVHRSLGPLDHHRTKVNVISNASNAITPRHQSSDHTADTCGSATLPAGSSASPPRRSAATAPHPKPTHTQTHTWNAINPHSIQPLQHAVARCVMGATASVSRTTSAFSAVLSAANAACNNSQSCTTTTEH